MIFNNDLLALKQSDQTDSAFDHLLGMTSMLVTNEWIYLPLDQVHHVREHAPYVYAELVVPDKAQLEKIMAEMD